LLERAYGVRGARLAPFYEEGGRAVYRVDRRGGDPWVLRARGPGFLVGAAVVALVTRRLGFGATVLLGGCMMGAGVLAAPLLDAGSVLLVPALAVGFFVNGLGNPLYNVNASTLRRLVTPERLLGRMQAAVRFVGRGGLPLGALLGGVIGEAYGVRAALLLASLGMLAAPLWLARSPVRTLRDPTAATAGADR
jgi:predicted MFS family arabinose efflux permease